MNTPIVDVVIPVHTTERPIAAAVASVLESCSTPVRVSVVCHNVSKSAIRGVLGRWADDDRVRLLTVVDGVPSPAGPVNAGLDAAEGEFTALLDSDDTLEPGAIDAWLRVQRRDDADVVIPPMKRTDGRAIMTPPVRPGRYRQLDAVKDRLAYRTRHCGLARREYFSTVRMTPGLRTGEDVVQGIGIYFTEARISYIANGPSYVISVEGQDRTSTTPKPAAETLLFLDSVLNDRCLQQLGPHQRRAVAVKILRTHVVDALRASLRTSVPETDFDAIADAIQRLRRASPTAHHSLSRYDQAIITELAGLRRPAILSQLLTKRTQWWRWQALVPSNPLRMLDREAPLRLLGAVAALRISQGAAR